MITLELTCVCGEALSYEGDRAGERLARAEWASGHDGHVAPKPQAPEPVEVHRDAGTGRFVTEQYAEDNPATTVEETTAGGYTPRSR